MKPLFERHVFFRWALTWILLSSLFAAFTTITINSAAITYFGSNYMGILTSLLILSGPLFLWGATMSWLIKNQATLSPLQKVLAAGTLFMLLGSAFFWLSLLLWR